VVLLPGLDLGNLRRDEAQAFLKMKRGQVGPRGAMLVGVDSRRTPTFCTRRTTMRRGSPLISI